jgi:hypothetical protein
MGSRKECDWTETDGSWEVMDYGRAEDVGCEGHLEKGIVHEPHIHDLDADVDPIGEKTAVCDREEGQMVTMDDMLREKETALLA